MKFLFISGWQRSGTTFITRKINCHPEITVISDPFSIFFKLIRRKVYKLGKGEDCKLKKPFEVLFPFQKNEYQLYEDYLQEVYVTSDDLQLIKKEMLDSADVWPEQHAPLLISDWDRITPGYFEEVLLQILDLIEKKYSSQKSEVVGFKMPYCEQFYEPFIKSLQIDTKCINVLRDVRNAYLSRNQGRYYERAGGESYSVIFTCRNWRKSVMLSLKLRNNKNFTSIRYEDFILKERQQTILSDVAKMLGVDQASENFNNASLRDGFNNKWESNSSFKKVKKKEIDPNVKFLIDFFCEAELKTMGYDVNDNLTDIDKFREVCEKVHANEKNIRPWQKYYGYTLSKSNIHKEVKRKELYEKGEVSHKKAELNFIDRDIYDVLSKNIHTTA